MLKDFEKYNKFWGALIPVLVWGLNEYFGAGVTVEGVEQWSNDLILLLSPVFAFWMTNKSSE